MTGRHPKDWLKSAPSKYGGIVISIILIILFTLALNNLGPDEEDPEYIPHFDIYQMKLHQVEIVHPKGEHYLTVTRVPGGWVYKNVRGTTFVPVPER